MARNGKTGSTGDFGDARSTPKPRNMGFDIKHWLSPYLDEKDQIWLRDNYDNVARFVLDTLGELPAGYDLSSKFDDRTDRWLATLKCVRMDDPNKGIAITGRGSTRVNSIYTCLFIAGIKLEWRWLEAVGSSMGDFG